MKGELLKLCRRAKSAPQIYYPKVTIYNIGLARTHLQHLLTASAINLIRAVAWLKELPRSQTRRSHFAALAAA